MRLHSDGFGDTEVSRDAHPFANPLGRIVRHGGVAHEPVSHERAERRNRLFERGLGVVVVGVVQVDRVDAEALEGCLGRGAHVRSREPAELGVLADLRRDDQVLACTRPCGQPLADDPFALAARVSGHPCAVGIRRVDEVTTGLDEGVEERERGVAVGRPAEYVAAEGEGEDVEVAGSDSAHVRVNRSAATVIPPPPNPPSPPRERRPRRSARPRC